MQEDRLTGHETLESTGSEIVSREIDPVLFIDQLLTDSFPLSSCAQQNIGEL